MGRANIIAGGFGGQQQQQATSGGPKRRREDDGNKAQGKRQRQSYSSYTAGSSLADLYRDAQQKKAAALAQLAKLDKAIASKKECLAKFGITDFTSGGLRTLDLAKVDAEYVRRRDEAALARAKKGSSEQGGLSASANTASEHSDAMIHVSSGPSSDAAAPMAGPNPVVEGFSPDELSSNNAVGIPYRPLNREGEMRDAAMHVPDVIRACMRHRAYGECNYGLGCLDSHEWADVLVNHKLFQSQRAAGKLPDYSVAMLQERGL